MNDEIFYGRMRVRAKNEILLDYYLIRESIRDDYCDLSSYGAKVIQTMYEEGGGKTVESKEISNIFYKSEDADKFIKLIMKNKVMPVTLMDVVEDYIIEDIVETA